MALKLKLHLLHVLSVSRYASFLLFQQSVVKTSARLSGKYCNVFPVEFLQRFPSWNIDAPFVLTHPQDSHWLGPFMWLL